MKGWRGRWQRRGAVSLGLEEAAGWCDTDAEAEIAQEKRSEGERGHFGVASGGQLYGREGGW